MLATITILGQGVGVNQFPKFVLHSEDTFPYFALEQMRNLIVDSLCCYTLSMVLFLSLCHQPFSRFLQIWHVAYIRWWRAKQAEKWR